MKNPYSLEVIKVSIDLAENNIGIDNAEAIAILENIKNIIDKVLEDIRVIEEIKTWKE